MTVAAIRERDGGKHAVTGVDPDCVPSRVMRLVHTVGRFKQQIQAASRGEAEWAYNLVLFHLVSTGPLRASALAESVHADPSTVSRQVGALVKDGLIRRQADPEDGRASLLAATDQGLALYSRHIERRDGHYRAMLANWSARDVQRFADLLARFTTDFEAYKHIILADVTGAVPADAAGREEQ